MVELSARRGLRFKDRAALMRAAQEAALKKWNADAGRPTWDRGGAMLRHVCPGPVDLDSLHYLTDEARAGLRPWAERDARYKKAERAALRSMRSLSAWIARARAILGMLRETDVGGGAGLSALRRLLVPADGSTPELVVVAAPFADVRLNRTDQDRAVIAIEAGRLLRQNRREVTAPELAYASILCGTFPEGLRIGPRGCTAAEVLEAERRLMARAMNRYSRTRRTSN